MQTRVDLDPEDLQRAFPDIVIQCGEGRDARDVEGIRKDLEACGCAFVKKVIDAKVISQARGVVMRHLLDSNLVTTEAGDCPSGQGILLTGFRDVTHHRDMLYTSLSRLVEGPELRALMTKIIGGPVETYDTKWVRVMAPGNSTETHSVSDRQDYYRFQSMRREKMVICWVPLGECQMRQGPLVVCSASHSVDYSSGVIEFTEIPQQFTELVDNSVWLSYNFEPGDLCVFDVKSLHASLK